MANVHRIPDLARMRAIDSRVRASSDEEVADLLTTDEGQWLFVECASYMADDVARLFGGGLYAVTSTTTDERRGPMSGNFAEREHRRAKGIAPAEDVESQIDTIEERLREMRRAVRLVTKEIGTSLHELDALRRDVAATKKGKR